MFNIPIPPTLFLRRLLPLQELDDAPEGLHKNSDDLLPAPLLRVQIVLGVGHFDLDLTGTARKRSGMAEHVVTESKSVGKGTDERAQMKKLVSKKSTLRCASSLVCRQTRNNPFPKWKQMER